MKLFYYLFIVVGVFAIIFMIATTMKSYTSPSGTSQQITDKEDKKDLKIVAHFTGTKFEIINLDDYDCENALLVVNNEYELKGYTLGVGQSYEVGAAQFMTSDGTRFNPFSMKPQSFAVICQGNNELSNVSWTGTF